MKNTEIYINALLTGNDLIIREMYITLYPKIRSYVVTNRGLEEDALDVFHDGLMYIMVTYKEKKPEIKSFEAYLFVICKNLWKRTLKNRVIKEDVSTLEGKEEDLSLFILEQECYDFYLEKFQNLSQNCKDILSGYFNGQTYEELLDEYNYASINTVRQRVFKCRAKLIKLLKDDKRYQKIMRWRKK